MFGCSIVDRMKASLAVAALDNQGAEIDHHHACRGCDDILLAVLWAHQQANADFVINSRR